MIIIGHRGASGHQPENTLAAFRAAEAMGCAWVELDVHLLEGTLLVIHDDQVDRTTSGSGTLSELGLKAVRELDAGRGERVPTLNEVLAELGGRVSVNIELKGPGTAAPVSQLLDIQCATSTWQPQQFLLSSFDHHELTAADARYNRGVLWGRPQPNMVADSVRLGGQWMNIARRSATQRLVREAQEAGLKVAVYTVNELDHMQEMAAIGVDAIFSDYPDRGLQAGFAADFY